MTLHDRIGVDLGGRRPLEEGLASAARHGDDMLTGRDALTRSAELGAPSGVTS